MCSALCNADISAGSAISGVYVRPGNHGNFAGSPWICVWQSQAPAGTSKFTGVDGCDAFANEKRVCSKAPAAAVPSTKSRLVIMISSCQDLLWLLAHNVTLEWRWPQPRGACLT